MGQHWYTADAKPAHFQANGKETTLREARKASLFPSTTSILQIQDKPALTNWFVSQALEAAYDTPIPGAYGDRQGWIDAVRSKSKEYAEKRRDDGTALHEAIEKRFLGQPFDPRWKPHCEALEAALADQGINLKDGEAEKVAVSLDGYGCRTDWHSKKLGIVADIKSKDRIEDGKRLAWDDHALQLHANARALGMDLPTIKLQNWFVGVDDCKVHIHTWEWDDRYMQWFLSLLKVWCLSKNYFPVKQSP